jgi:hypothetical protein
MPESCGGDVTAMEQNLVFAEPISSPMDFGGTGILKPGMDSATIARKLSDLERN